MRITTGVAVFVLLTLSASAQQRKPGQYTVYGTGTTSCGRWLSEHRSTDDASILAFSQTNWVLGFVSGAGWTGSKEIRLTDVDAMRAWMTQYCEKNPLDDLSTGAENLVQTLRQ